VPRVSRKKGGGEEGRSQLRVEGLGAALIGGGGWRCGLDEIRRGGRVLVPGNWLNELSGVRGTFGFLVGCSSSKNGAREGRGDGGKGEWGGGSSHPVGRATDGGGRWSARCGSSGAGAKGGSDRGGPRLGHCHGPAPAHSADFDLNKDFKIESNSNDQKLVLCCSKIFKQNMKS
jgi:hypothetical protein